MTRICENIVETLALNGVTIVETWKRRGYVEIQLELETGSKRHHQEVASPATR